jgi:hypothetical protein
MLPACSCVSVILSLRRIRDSDADHEKRILRPPCPARSEPASVAHGYLPEDDAQLFAGSISRDTPPRPVDNEIADADRRRSGDRLEGPPQDSFDTGLQFVDVQGMAMTRKTSGRRHDGGVSSGARERALEIDWLQT